MASHTPTQQRHETFCAECNSYVDGIGPWCKLYTTSRYCTPMREARRIIFEADSQGDGPLVNALCAYIRRMCGDEFVP